MNNYRSSSRSLTQKYWKDTNPKHKYRVLGSTHQSPTKDRISRGPHKKARQEAKVEVVDEGLKTRGSG